MYCFKRYLVWEDGTEFYIYIYILYIYIYILSCKNMTWKVITGKSHALRRLCPFMLVFYIKIIYQCYKLVIAILLWLWIWEYHPFGSFHEHFSEKMQNCFDYISLEYDTAWIAVSFISDCPVTIKSAQIKHGMSPGINNIWTLDSINICSIFSFCSSLFTFCCFNPEYQVWDGISLLPTPVSLSI